MHYVKPRVYRKTVVLLCILAFSIIAGIPALANASGAYSDWHYMRTVTIDHTKVPSTLTDFPTLITLTDTDLKVHAQSNGYDILFTLQDGTKLSHEIESYNSATGKLVAWVKIPSVSSTTDTTINMYYGNPSASNQQDPTHVWDSNNYKAVWHLPNGVTLTALDSTGNNKNGGINGVTATTGQIGGAAGNFKVNNYISVTDTTYFNLANIAVSAWIKPSGTQGANTDVIDKYHDSTNGWVLEYDNSGQKLIFFMSGNSGMISAQSLSATVINDNNWHYVVGTCDGSTVKLYVDGILQASTSYSGSAKYTNGNLAIGRWEKTPGRYFNGAIDEVTISSVARSDAWVTAQYNNQKNPATFAVFSSEIVNPAVSVLPESPVGSLAVVLTIAVGCGVFVKYKSSIRFKA